jgi:hypothetical protein
VLYDLPDPYGGGGEPECEIFPADNPWNTDISDYPLHPMSDDYVDQIGRTQHLHPDVGTIWQGAPIGIPYVIVDGEQPKVPVSFYYDEESDPGPYPIPPDAPIEGGEDAGGDRHVLVIDDDNCILYETFDSWPLNGGAAWETGSGAVWDLSSNELRPEYWTSADAAGLPIFAGLIRYEEVVEQGEIDHAIRFTVSETRRAFIHPATHYASNDEDTGLPPMGLRFRMRADYDCSWASDEVQVICTALKKYGMLVADNGSDWYLSGSPDPRWDDDALGDLKDITGDAFEVVYTGPAITEEGPEGTPWPTPQPGETPQPTATPTAAPTAEPTPTASPGTEPTDEPGRTDTPSPTGGPEPTPTPTATPGPEPSDRPDPTGVREPSPTPTPTPLVTEPPQNPDRKDVDCDGKVDVIDPLAVLRHVAGLSGEKAAGCPDPGGETASGKWADFNCDGEVDVIDALFLLRHIAGFVVTFPSACPG